MSHNTIGCIQRVPIRNVWRHEAHNFTQWLERNINILDDVIDFTIVSVEREKAAGAFNIDLVAEDENGNTIIIENQLEKSDHDHLGKVITYLATIQAKTAIWIVTDPRPEHVNAINWLNETSDESFYMIKLEAVRIDDSPPAPLFTLIVGPSDEVKSAGVTKKELAERHILRKRWWTTLLNRSTAINHLHAHITPTDNSWLSTSAGVRGLSFNYVVTQEECGAELYIDRGKNTADENKSIFSQLQTHQSDIEHAFGAPLSWEKLDEKRACRIKYSSMQGGYRTPEEQWPQVQDDLIGAMHRLEMALRPYIQKVSIHD